MAAISVSVARPPCAAARDADSQRASSLQAAAEYEYAHDRFGACYKLTSRVREQDPFEQNVLPVHVCAMPLA